jgi:hypothetical protein
MTRVFAAAGSGKIQHLTLAGGVYARTPGHWAGAVTTVISFTNASCAQLRGEPTLKLLHAGCIRSRVPLKSASACDFLGHGRAGQRGIQIITGLNLIGQRWQ